MHMHVSLLIGGITGLDVMSPARAQGAAEIPTVRAARDWIGRALCDWRASAQERQARAALLALPDHLLRDIGVSRHEIEDPVVLEPSRWRTRS